MRGNAECAHGLWPSDIAVPPRPVLGLRDAPLGTEEGELCLRFGDQATPCPGKIEIMLPGPCYCAATHAPCGSCLGSFYGCRECGWRDEAAA